MMRIILLVLLVVFGSSSGASALPSNNPITAGLVAAYEFSGNADDVSGNGNNGVVNGATLTTDRFGNVGSAYSFDGVDDYIDLGNQNFGSAASVSLWVNLSQITGHPQHIISKYDGDTGPGDLTIDRTFDLFYGGAGGLHKFALTFSEDGVATSFSGSTTGALASEWYYLVAIFENGAASLYVDGVRETSWNTGYSTLYTSNIKLLLGAVIRDHPIVQDYDSLSGSIDDVYIYDRALSPTEVSTLYSAVPEPSTALLLGIGLSALAATSRRRSQS